MNIIKSYGSKTFDMHSFTIWVANCMSQAVHQNYTLEEKVLALEAFHNAIACYLKEKIDFNNLTEQEMKTLGFRQWDENSSLMLIPIYLYSALPEGLEVTSIDGKKSIVGTDKLDTDTRYQLLSFGLYPKNKEEEHK